MKCTEMGEQLMDVAAGTPPASGVAEHLGTCTACAARLESLRRTMALLDEWPAPEASPYFETRLAARLREEAAAHPSGLLFWLRKPALALTMAALMTVGLVSLYHTQELGQSTVSTQAQPGTAVGDLQDLEKNHELFANFDLLDDLAEQQHLSGAAVNP